MKTKAEGLIRKAGTFSALYLAISYGVGIIIFLAVLQYPSVVDSSQKFLVVLRNSDLIFVTNLLLYILFGPFLVALVITLDHVLRDSEELFLKIGKVFGYIWAGSLVASGMIANSGLLFVETLYKTNAGQAEAVWCITDAIAMGIGNGNGEILGGVFTLSIGISGLVGGRLSKFASYWGCLVGAIGILSVAPVLNDLTGVFGLLQIVWFLSLAIFLTRNKAVA